MIISWRWKIKLPKPLHIGAFDSALEFSWNHLLESLGLSPVHHPGSFFLPTANRYYEPDFLLESPNPTDTPDFYLEAKGPAMERIEKPYEFSDSYHFPMILLLSPQFPQDPAYNSLESPWAEWRTINTPNILLRPSKGFLPPSEAHYHDYVPGSLYHTLSPSLKEFFRPLDHPHYSLIDS